jgi:hypothetical protein
MKLVGVISTAVLSLALGVAAPAFAQEQHDQDEKSKPEVQEEKKAQPEKSAKQEQAAKPEEKNAKQEDKNTKPAEKAAAGNEQQHAAGNGGGRIPADRYQANFGRQHTFHVSQGDYRNHRFQYGGYWFGFADAWPSNWLYTQDVYVVEINGIYYLCNPSYPGVNVTLSLTL